MSYPQSHPKHVEPRNWDNDAQSKLACDDEPEFREPPEPEALPVKPRDTCCTAAPDMVNHPPHYTHSLIQPIDVIESWKLGFCLGSVVSYIGRCDHKGNRLQDLEKAAWFLDREIEYERKLRE